MGPDLDRRTYDLLRLIRYNEPIGSIRLVDLMQQRGYDIKDRTIRLLLGELDEAGLTRKVAGKGRSLTDAGRAELDRGDLGGRLTSVRERIATVTSQVTYDPVEETGAVVACDIAVAPDELSVALEALGALDDSALGPVPVTIREDDDEAVVSIPSSVTLDGVLLSHGIATEMVTAGLVEYRADEGIVRFVDALSGEGSTMDGMQLLVDAGRTDVEAALDADRGVLLVDNRDVPLVRFSEVADLAAAVADVLGGAVELVRPREDGPMPRAETSWEFASLTYAGSGELAAAQLAERGLVRSWETLVGTVPFESFRPLPDALARLAD